MEHSLHVERGRLHDEYAGASRKAFTLHTPALQATWTRFPSLGPEPALCILQESCVTTCTYGGFLLDTPLAGVARMWPSSHGLLLQACNSGVLLLDHPAGSAAPVVADSSQQAHVGLLGARLGGWCNETVMWSSPDLPLVVTYNKDGQRAALWSLGISQTGPQALGHLPELPAVTPNIHWSTATGAGTPWQQQQAGHATGAGGGATSGIPQPSPMGSVAAATPWAGTPPAWERGDQSGWPRAMKRPVARTSVGGLSPAMFSARPRSALGWGQGSGHADPSAWGAASNAPAAAGSQVPSTFFPGASPLAGLTQISTSATQCAARLLAQFTLPGLDCNRIMCFPVCGLDGALLLAVMDPSRAQLIMLPITRPAGKIVQLPALAAVPVNPGRPATGATWPSHLIVLAPGGSLCLCWGAQPLCVLNGSMPGRLAQVLLPGRVPHMQAALPRLIHVTGQPDSGYIFPLPPVTGLHARGPTDGECLRLDLGAGAGMQLAQAAVEVQPCSWLVQLVLERLLGCVSQETAAVLLKAMHLHAGHLSGCPELEWEALQWMLNTALAGPERSAASHPTASSELGLPSPLQALPTGSAYNSPQTRRFAALSLASPAVRKGLFHDAPQADQQPSEPSSTTGAAAGDSAWEQLQGSCLSHGPHGSLARARYPWAARRRANSNKELGTDMRVETGGDASMMGVLDELQGAGKDVQGAPTDVQGVLKDVQGVLVPQGMDVLRTLHALYEDLKLDLCRHPALPQLGGLLACCASSIGSAAATYWKHYACDLGPGHMEHVGASAPAVTAGSDGTSPMQGMERPTDLLSELSAMAHGCDLGSGLQDQDVGLPRTHALRAFFHVLYTCSVRCSELHASCLAGDPSRTLGSLRKQLYRSSCDLALAMVTRGWGRQQLETLPVGLALPLQHMLSHCRTNPPPGWRPAAYALVGREDIAATVAAAKASPSGHEQTSPGTAQLADPAGVQPAGLGRPYTAMHGPAAPSTRHPDPAATPCDPGAGMAWEGHGLDGGGYGGRGRTGQPLGTGAGGGGQQTPAEATAWALTVGSSGRTAGDQPAQTLDEGPSGWIRWQPAHQQHLHLPAHHAPAVDSALRSAPAPGPPCSSAAKAKAAAAHNSGAAQRAEAASWAQHVTKGMGFGGDGRLCEVVELLSSSMPVKLQLDLPESDPELPAKQQQQLLASSLRTMSLAVGRGALCLGTVTALPTEPLLIPPLCLAGTSGEQQTTTINLDLSTAHPAPGGGAAADITAWPEFHNGVAAGLRMAGLAEAGTGGAAAGAVRQCLVPTQPDTPSYTHAGLLLALGITGHLSRLAWTDLYRYLSEQHDATTIAAMLGRAAYARGSMDALTSKMLCLHLPATHPSSFPELELSPLVQAAALLGVGLLFEGTCHRQMAETMIQELGRTPAPARGQGGISGESNWGAGASGAAAAAAAMGTVTSDREGYALAAGFALGLITLGTGRQAAGLHDINLEARLRFYLGGSSSTTATAPALPRGGAERAPEAYTSAALAPFRHGSGPLSAGPQVSLAAQVQRLIGREAHVEGSAAQAITGSTAPQVLLEGVHPNLSVTSPAACMALTLMFLQTNDAQAAAAFDPPATRATLRQQRPDLLRLRAVGRALVMWGDVQPSVDWLKAQLPPVLGDRDLSAAVAKACRMEGAAQQDHLAALLGHMNVLAGACMGLGLRYAGSADQQAYTLLHSQLGSLLRCKRHVVDTAPAVGPGVVTWGAAAAGAARTCLDKGHVEACVAVVVTAMALVMAGTGDLPTFRLLTALSRRRHPSHGHVVAGLGLNYGTQMAVSSALGLLFLGGGRQSIRTTPSAIAALLIAFYPVMPSTPVDNRCHLQAFRHLYVLAAQPRCVEAVDVLTHQLVYLPISICMREDKEREAGRTDTGPEPGVLQVRNGDGPGVPTPVHGGKATSGAAAMAAHADTRLCGALERVAPCLLPELEQVQSVSISSARYWPQILANVSQPAQPQQQHGGPQQHPRASHGAGLALHLRQSPSPGASAQPSSRAGPTIPAAHLTAFNPANRAHAGSGPHYGGNQGRQQTTCTTSMPGQRSAGTQTTCHSDRQSASQLVFVRTRSGCMSYADDPMGTRSMLAQSYMGAPGPMPGMVGGEAQLSVAAADSAGVKLTRLIATFHADPSTMGLSHALGELWQLHAGRSGAEASSPEGHQGSGADSSEAGRLHTDQRSDGMPLPPQPLQRLPGPQPSEGDRRAQAADLLRFCHQVLCGSVTGERPEMGLADYLQLYSLQQTLQGMCPAAQVHRGSQLQPDGGARHDGAPKDALAFTFSQATTKQLQSLYAVRAYLRSPLAAASRLVLEAAAVGQPATPEQQLLQQPFVEGLWALFQQTLLRVGALPSIPSAALAVAHGLVPANLGPSQPNSELFCAMGEGPLPESTWDAAADTALCARHMWDKVPGEQGQTGWAAREALAAYLACSRGAVPL